MVCSIRPWPVPTKPDQPPPWTRAWVAPPLPVACVQGLSPPVSKPGLAIRLVPLPHVPGPLVGVAVALGLGVAVGPIGVLVGSLVAVGGYLPPGVGVGTPSTWPSR